MSKVVVRGSRLGEGRVKVSMMSNGQFRVTIPKVMALGYGLFSGSVVDWEITQRGLLLKRVKKEVKEKDGEEK